MAVTTATLFAPFDNSDYGILRPGITVGWTGGTGPFDVVYEWDDNTSFTSPITVTNESVTSPDSAVPTSDLGGYGTDWYFRATVYDLSDTGTDEIQSVDNDATGGTFDLTFDGQTATNVPYNESAANLKTTLEALSNITSVTVTGTGTTADPWLVTFTDPGNKDLPLMTADDTNLTGHTVGTTISESTKGVYPSGTQAPSTYYTLSFTDPDDHPRHLYTYHNIKPNWAATLDGDPDDFARHLYVYHNITPGWVTGIDGAPEEFNRHLYLNHDITSDQPCPWIESVTPSIQTVNKSIVITGDSFGATQVTYGGEVRLYSSPTGSSYVAMSPTLWADDSITVTVPSGASSGWVGVVHTTGTPSCTGSNRRYLTVESTPADAEAGWWIEITDYKNATIQTAQPNVVAAYINPVMNSIGSGRLDVPLSDQYLDDLIDPENYIGRFARAYLDNRYRYGFFLENLRHDVTDDGGSIAAIEGLGLERISEWAVIYPHDHPANPTKSPTWIYGSTDNFISNPGFEDELEILKNPGGEDGNTDDGTAEGWSVRGNNLDYHKAVQNDTNSLTGSWYLEFKALDNHSGITQSVSCEPNKVYHVQTYVKDPLASSMRVTLALGGADDIASTGTYSNNFEFGDEILAELDNVARNPASNGLPGGSTDGTWQVMDVEVKTGKEQKSLTISIQNDHHGSGIFNPIWVDDVTIEGWGLGLDPWVAYDGADHASNSFRLSEAWGYNSSDHSCYVNPTGQYAGIQQIVSVAPNTKYTLTCFGYTSGITSGDTWDLVARYNDGDETLIDKDSVTVAAGTNTFQVVFTTDDTGADEDGNQEIIVRFAYTGPNNPGPMYADSFSLVPGEPPSTPGTILNDILGPIQDRGTIDWLQVSFDADYDSAGNPWYSYVALDINPGETLKDVLDRLVALSYEWEIVPVNFHEGGDTGAELNVYNNRSFGSGIGFDRTKGSDGIVVVESGRNSISGGRVNKRVFTGNRIFAIDQDGNWSEAESSDYSSDLTAYGRIEGYLQATVGSSDTLADFADSVIRDAEDSEFAVKFNFARDDYLRPFLHFGIGDTVYVDPTPYGERDTKRIRSIATEMRGEGNDIRFDVNTSKVIFEDEAAVIAAINQLKERGPADNSGVGTGRSSSSATGFVQTTITSETVVPHTHKLSSPEIKDKALSGDISGELPGPVTVNKVKGRPVSSTIPTDTGGQVYWIFDRALNTWVPTEIDITTIGSGKATTFMLGGM